MSELRVTVIPVGKVDAAEVEAAASRVSKVLHRPLELREAAGLPRGTEDVDRGQHDAKKLMNLLRADLPRLKVARLVGTPPTEAVPLAAPSPDAVIFVTDVDLFLPGTVGVSSDYEIPRRVAILSVRRLREAFYKRKADPAKLRARVAKELLRLIGRLSGAAECRDPRCALAPVGALADLDLRQEKYCAACWRRLSTGVVRF